jgi:Tol biopolymer transport system component
MTTLWVPEVRKAMSGLRVRGDVRVAVLFVAALASTFIALGVYREAGTAAASHWLVYKTTAKLAADYGCADVPSQLDRLRTWPGGRTLPAAGQTVEDPAWSPAGTQIAFSSGDYICTTGDGIGQMDARIWVVDSNGADLHGVTGTEGALDRSPTWSPDGHEIAFARVDISRGTAGIYIIGADGRDLRRVSGQSALAVDWSPDGHSLAFVPGERLAFGDSAANRVAVINIRSKRIHVLRVRDPYDLAWSPDGHTLAVTGSAEILLIDTTGSRIRRISLARSRARLWLNGVTFAPDGRHIAYSYGGTISTVALTGHGTTRVVAGDAPDWKP